MEEQFLGEVGVTGHHRGHDPGWNPVCRGVAGGPGLRH